jgi:hypothetical protein
MANRFCKSEPQGASPRVSLRYRTARAVPLPFNESRKPALASKELSRKALTAGADRKKKTSGKGQANKPAASALPLR